MRFSEREAFYSGLKVSEKELVKKEVQRIGYFRNSSKTRHLYQSDPIPLVTRLEAARSKWRKVAFERCNEQLDAYQTKIAKGGDKVDPLLERNCRILRRVQLWESKEYGGLQDAVFAEKYIPQFSIRVEDPDESNYGYNGWVIVFDKGSKGVTINHPLCHGQFPNQKISIQKLLYNKTDTPLKRTMDKDQLRYFHLPANNMKWVEVRVIELQLHPRFD